MCLYIHVRLSVCAVSVVAADCREGAEEREWQ